jgi:hypothetical protein
MEWRLPGCARALMLHRYDKEFKDTANKGSYCYIEFLSVYTHKYIWEYQPSTPGMGRMATGTGRAATGAGRAAVRDIR